MTDSPRIALTAYSRRERVYYYVLNTGHIQRVRLQSEWAEAGLGEGGGVGEEEGGGGRLRAVELSAIRVGGDDDYNNYVLALSLCDIDGMLYTLEGPWPHSNDDVIFLASYDSSRGAMVSRKATAITGADMAYAAAEFYVNMQHIVLINSHGAISTYNIYSNQVIRETARDLGMSGTIIGIVRLQDRTPSVTAVTSPSVLTGASMQITVTGFNFGMRDFSPIVAFRLPLSLPCKESRWLSDNAIVCLGFPATEPSLKTEFDNKMKTDFDFSLDARVTVQSRKSNIVLITTFIESWARGDNASLCQSSGNCTYAHTRTHLHTHVHTHTHSTHVYICIYCTMPDWQCINLEVTAS